MDPRQELEELRRLDELERKAQSQDLGEIRKAKQKVQASQYYNMGGEKTLSDLVAPDRAVTNVSELPWYTRAAGGAKAAWDQAAMGLKGMFTDLTPEDKAMLAGGRAFVDQGGAAATVGNIAGDVAMTAAPALRAQQGIMAGARFLPKAMQFVGGSLPAAMIAGGATSAALTPENRGTAAAGGALGAGAGELAGRVLTKTLGGVMSNKVTPEAQTLMDQGAFVPMWKATDSKVARNLAERARALPVTGDIIKSQERQGVESWNRILAKEATPPTPVLDDAGNVLRWTVDPVKQVGSDGLNELAGKFNKAYDALYGNRGIPVDDVFGQEVGDLVTGVQRYYPSQAADVQGIVNKVVDTLTKPVQDTVTKTGGGPMGKGIVTSRLTSPVVTTTTPGREVVSHQAVKTALDDVERAIKSAWGQGNADKAEALMALRDSIESLRMRGLPPEVAAEAQAINTAYAKFKTLERAAGTLGAQKQGGVVTPAQQLNSIRARDRTPGKSAFARGNAPGQQQALTAQQVYGNELPDVGPGTAEKLMPFLGFGLPMMGADLGGSLLLGTQTGQRALMGQLPGQAGIRQYGNEYLVPALRQFGMQAGN